MGAGELHRTIDWRGAFWVASGVPALVLFSIGGIGGVGGSAAVAIWAVSMLMGFVQSFTYAEIAGLFPSKSGGASVYGAAAWLKYGRFIAPLSVWCNWLAWTPVLSLGCAIAAGYILNGIAPIPGAESAAVVQWLADPANAGRTAEDAVAALTPALQVPFVEFDIGSIVHIGIGMPFVIGAMLMLLVFAIQHRGILGTARVQMVVGLVIVIVMLIFGLVPLLQGKVQAANFTPLVPSTGAWDLAGWTLVLGGMFIAAWSTYAFETAICYTSEFKDPATDTFKAIFDSGLLCLVLYILVPFTFQGVLGVAGMTDPAVVAGFYYLILALSNCGYIIFNFLNLNAGWIHRVDNGHVHRPYRAPTILLAAGTILAFVNAFFMGAGAAVWDLDPDSGWDPLWLGLIAAALVIPVFWFRHYVQDGASSRRA